MAISNQTLAGLIRLQEIDNALLRIERRLVEGPKLVERRSDKFHESERKIAAAQDRIRHAKAGNAQLELELRSREKEIEKLLGQQNAARTNQEYRALGDHAERLRKECSAFEDRILEGMSGIEAAESELKELEAVHAELRAERESFEGQWQRDAKEYDEELARIRAERDRHAASLPKPALEIYERVLRGRNGEAVVAVTGRVCGGCQMTLLPNDLARLRGGADLVTCKSCERILYFPEASGSTTRS